jgi:glutathione S-transferase
VALTLWYHPLSSFCWKALIALYEGDVAFTPRFVNLGDPADRAAFQAVWPLAKFPVLEDDATGAVTPESTIIVEWLAANVASARGLVPEDSNADIHLPFQQIVGERMRPAEAKDPTGVAQNKRLIAQGYDLIAPMLGEWWALGEAFTLADCAALPALYYGDYGVSLDGWPSLRAYLDRLKARPSVARVLAEAQPYFQYFPLKDG